MLVHLTGAFFDRKCVPVLTLTTAAVHGVKANVFVWRNIREQPGMHRLALPLQCFVERTLPLFRVRLDTFLDQVAVRLETRFIQTKLNHRQIRSRYLQIITQPQIGQLHLVCVQFFETAAEVNEHQVALMAKDGVKRRLP